MEKQFNLELDSNGMVSSRDIHGFLGIKRNYTNWIEYWTKESDYEANVDFITKLLKSTGGRPKVDFLVNKDMAMTLVMTSGGQFAKQLRKHLISLFDKRENLELITPEEAVFANKVIRCLKYIEYQKKAKIMHEENYMHGKTKYNSLYAEFNMYRNSILGIDKKEIESLVNEYILKNEHPIKSKSVIGRLNQIDPSEALRIACMDLLLAGNTDLDTANKFASLVKKMAKLDNLETLPKNETNLFQIKESEAEISIVQKEIAIKNNLPKSIN
jgi:phage anti-repressor protein